MKKYIDKQKFLEELKKDLNNDCDIYNSHIEKELRDEKYNFTIDKVQNADCADVRENKHSKWIGVANLFDGNTYYHCSGCGCPNPYDKFEISPNKTFPNYCPNCGDKMYVER